MDSILHLFIRFSHVIFISKCCYHGPPNELSPKELPQTDVDTETSLQTRIPSDPTSDSSSEILDNYVDAMANAEM